MMRGTLMKPLAARGSVRQGGLARQDRLGPHRVGALDVARGHDLRGRRDLLGVEPGQRVDVGHEVAELRPVGRDLVLRERQPRELRDVANVDPVRCHDPRGFAKDRRGSVRRPRSDTNENLTHATSLALGPGTISPVDR